MSSWDKGVVANKHANNLLWVQWLVEYYTYIPKLSFISIAKLHLVTLNVRAYINILGYVQGHLNLLETTILIYCFVF